MGGRDDAKVATVGRQFAANRRCNRVPLMPTLEASTAVPLPPSRNTPQLVHIVPVPRLVPLTCAGRHHAVTTNGIATGVRCGASSVGTTGTTVINHDWCNYRHHTWHHYRNRMRCQWWCHHAWWSSMRRRNRQSRRVGVRSCSRGKRCVLGGDHPQLPPTIISSKAAKKGLSVTLFERLHALHGSQTGQMLIT